MLDISNKTRTEFQQTEFYKTCEKIISEIEYEYNRLGFSDKYINYYK